MKKKLAATLSVVLILGLAVLGILAYLTSEDGDVNVMTLGEVKIEQNEEQRVEPSKNGTLTDADIEDFVQDKPLYPYVEVVPNQAMKDEYEEVTFPDGNTGKLFIGDNAVDKFISVTNEGKSDAYVRTIIALEAPTDKIDVSVLSNVGWKIDSAASIYGVDIEGKKYDLLVLVYNNALKPGETTPYSLMQVLLDWTATNEDAALYGDTYDVIALSQAVQTAGFDDAKTALDTAFGAVSAEKAAEWITPIVEEYEESLIDSEEKLIKAIAAGETEIELARDFTVSATVDIPGNVTIKGAGHTISRAAGFTGTMLAAKENSTLTLEDVTLDGGGKAKAATGNLIIAESNAAIVLEEGAVLQNNVGAHAVNLGTRIGATLTLNGGEIINNSSASGAVWGGGHITINSGKISNNTSTGSAGAIRMVSNCNLTMNGGEISNNTAAESGGAIWGYGSSTYNLNGGKMSGNTAAVGGAMYTGDSSVINISGTFELIDNTADDAGAIRLSNRTAFNMTGGKVSGNTSKNSPNWDGFYGWNPAVNISGGDLADDIYIQGGLTPTVGGSGITGVVHFNVSTNHNTVNLAKEFGTIKFTVAEGSNFAAFNFKPAADYTYTAGDESKLVCMNEGYETYWNAATSTFKLQAK